MACKRPRSFWQKCRWQVTPKHAYTLDPSKSDWADNAAVQAECGNLSGNELTHNSSGNARLQSSQVSEPLWTDPGQKSGISLRELISIKKKKAQAGNELSNMLPKSSYAKKKTPPPLLKPRFLWCNTLQIWMSQKVCTCRLEICAVYPLLRSVQGVLLVGNVVRCIDL